MADVKTLAESHDADQVNSFANSAYPRVSAVETTPRLPLSWLTSARRKSLMGCQKISASEFAPYIDGAAPFSDAAERVVAEGFLACNAEYFSAIVADAREYAKSLMDPIVRSYDSLSASFVAKWCDYQADLNGAGLQQAIMAVVYTPKSVDEVARYQAKKLVKGDFAGFAKACGEYARNDALRSLNETIMANAKRDRKKDVRFARVPTGNETCTFCLMLAGRGAVYHSRKTAGEFKHFHRGCDCKVVPGFKIDPDAELVEGFKPKELREQWKEFKKIDERDDLTREQKWHKNRVVSWLRNSGRTSYSELYAERDYEVTHNTFALRQSQLTHIPGTPQNILASRARPKEPSCFTLSVEEISALIKKYAGHGEPESNSHGEWTKRELCAADHVVGYVVNGSGEKLPT